MVYSKDSFSDREGKPQAENFPGCRRNPQFPTGAAERERPDLSGKVASAVRRALGAE